MASCALRNKLPISASSAEAATVRSDGSIGVGTGWRLCGAGQSGQKEMSSGPAVGIGQDKICSIISLA